MRWVVSGAGGVYFFIFTLCGVLNLFLVLCVGVEVLNQTQQDGGGAAAGGGRQMLLLMSRIKQITPKWQPAAPFSPPPHTLTTLSPYSPSTLRDPLIENLLGFLSIHGLCQVALHVD